MDDYYDEPEDEDKEIEEIDIGDLVDGILSLSLNEASFQIASQKYSRGEFRCSVMFANHNRYPLENTIVHSVFNFCQLVRTVIPNCIV